MSIDVDPRLKFAFIRIHSRLTILCLTFLLGLSKVGGAVELPVRAGLASFPSEDLEPGKTFALDGEWLYKPGYALSTDEKPELSGDSNGYLPVPVPQLLNRIYWWLDDSEDFKKHEEERLKRLGFDTEKAEDGWYRLNLALPAVPKDRRLFLQFDGVAMRSHAFCNGKSLGERTGNVQPVRIRVDAAAQGRNERDRRLCLDGKNPKNRTGDGRGSNSQSHGLEGAKSEQGDVRAFSARV